MAAKQELDSMSLREMVYIFDHIWQLRFINQIVEYTDLRKVNDVLALSDLTDLEQQNLRKVLKRNSLFHDKINQDFLSTKATPKS
ncbi:putative nucleotidyltransferase substrate binding domain-containing protein [Agarivorans aestuarii]|uniref:Nucleotidyltransferase substrate binding domain-containing protein n=1 Tax=Agarivorans aestuarii TaxID=1563703 RepID=A0ABU7G025_9ALTE|nr:putative nucleotidyltransferase substrate binding domain-containing protein [Agarivorans aestuarii]